MNNLIKAVSKKDIQLLETLLNTSITDIDATIQIKDTPYTLLGYVTHHGWIEGMNYLCNRGADVNTATNSDHKTGDYPVHVATHAQREAALKVLLQKEANPNLRDADGFSPIYLAAKKGLTSIVKSLIQEGAHINIPYVRKGVEITELQAALLKQQWQTASLLIKHFSDQRLSFSMTKEQRKQLKDYLRKSQGKQEVIAILDKMSQQYDKSNRVTYYHFSSALNNPETEEITATSSKNSHYKTVINAVETSSLDNSLIEYLKKAYAKSSVTELQAALDKNPTILNQTITIKNHHYTLLGHALVNQWVAGINLLLRAKADLTIPIDSLENYALHLAVLFDDLEGSLVQTLLANNVNPNTKNKKGYTPLYLAAREGFRKIVEVLIEYGAELTVENGQQKVTALQIALIHKKWNTAGKLIQHLYASSLPFCITSSQYKGLYLNVLQHKKQIREIIAIMSRERNGNGEVQYRFSPKKAIATSAMVGNNSDVKSHTSVPKEKLPIATPSHAVSSEQNTKQSPLIQSSRFEREDYAYDSDDLSGLIDDFGVHSSASKGKASIVTNNSNNAIAPKEKLPIATPSHAVSSEQNIKQSPLIQSSRFERGDYAYDSDDLSGLIDDFGVHSSASKGKASIVTNNSNNAISATDVAKEVYCWSCQENVPETTTVHCNEKVEHALCFDCIPNWVGSRIGSGSHEMKCFAVGCGGIFDWEQDKKLQKAIKAEHMATLERIKEERNTVQSKSLTSETDEQYVARAMDEAIIKHCANSKCGNAIIKDDGCNAVKCDGCRTITCYTCSKDITQDVRISWFKHSDESKTCSLYDAGNALGRGMNYGSEGARHNQLIADAKAKAIAEIQRKNPTVDVSKLQAIGNKQKDWDGKLYTDSWNSHLQNEAHPSVIAATSSNTHNFTHIDNGTAGANKSGVSNPIHPK